MLKHCLKAEALVSKDQKVAIVNVQTAAVLAPQVMYWALSSQVKWQRLQLSVHGHLQSVGLVRPT